MRFKILLIVIIFQNSITIFCQRLDLFGGLNYNKYYDIKNTDTRFEPTYQSFYGYSLGLGIDKVNIKCINLGFEINIDHYGLKLDAESGGRAGGSETKAKIYKSLISFVFFPANVTILRKIDINVGLQVSKLLDENFEGNISGSINNGYSIVTSDYELTEIYDKYSSSTYYGLLGKISYEFNVTKTLKIYPQYRFYHGFSNEFIQCPIDTKTNRYYLCIGIRKIIR
jgi:hypothetical protein